MNVLTPIYFAFLALLIPVGLLYLIKPRRRRVTIPSLYIWHRMSRAQQANDLIKKIKRLISLLLHCALVAILAFALARPFFSERLVPERLVVILDVSASMSALAEARPDRGPRQDLERTRFDEARDFALKLVADLSPEDELMIVEAASRPKVLLPLGADTARMREVLANLEPRAAPTNLGGAIDLGMAVARQIAVKTARKKEQADRSWWSSVVEHRQEDVETVIYVLSDGTDAALRPGPSDEVSPEPTLPERTRLTYVPFGGRDSPNVGITAFEVRELLNSPGDHEVLATAYNYSGRELAVRPELYFEGQYLEALPEVILAPRSDAPLPISETSLSRTGILELRLSVTRVAPEGGGALAAAETLGWRDVLALDDAAFAVVPKVRRKKVLLVSATRNHFLEAALAQDLSVAALRLDPSGYPPEDLASYDLVIFDRFLPEALPEQDLMFFAVRGAAAPVGGDGQISVPLLRDHDRSHPVMRYVQFKNVSFLKAQKLIPPADRRWQVLVSSFRGPLVLAGDLAERRMVYVAFESTDTDIVLRKSWPIFVSNALEWLSARRREAERIPGFRVGSVASIPVKLGQLGPGEPMAVWPPRGAAPVEVSVHDGRASLARTEDVGVYAIAERGAGPMAKEPPASARRFTVNLLSRPEGVVARAPRLGLGEDVVERWDAGFEVELREHLMLVALALLVIEALLFHFLSVF